MIITISGPAGAGKDTIANLLAPRLKLKLIQGSLRVFAKEKKIDILLFPDGDEIFANYLPEILIDFWNRKDKIAITMRPVSVYGDMKTISKMTMAGHSRIFKFFPELSGVPGQGFCHYHPLTKVDRLNTVKVLIHLRKRDWIRR